MATAAEFSIADITRIAVFITEALPVHRFLSPSESRSSRRTSLWWGAPAWDDDQAQLPD